ncbi:MAG: diacylglycerol kinase family lipid kinase [Lachnospiraceae bacterium]|nr:diacylglycerol kinase family lipid kinase [Lachnospiraceae bacterium]
MPSYKKLLFIVNPHAGVRKKESVLTDIILTFSDFYYETIVCCTREAGDASRIVREHVDDEIDRIVCMGGDGTLSEVIGACRAYEWDKPIGYIPAGSTNDFAASLKLPMEPAEAAERVMRGKPHRLDIGRFNGGYFVYTASCGLFTKASYDTPQRTKNLIGHLAYVLEGMKELTQIRSWHMRIMTEGRVYEDNYLFVSICNTFSLGGVMNLEHAQVSLSDGLFELLLISMPRDLLQLRDIIQSLREQKFESPLVQFRKVDQLTISCPDKADWSLDGEKSEGKEKTEIAVIPGAVRILY